ncbi:uncharacterized protein AB675_4862 [Cyphellophora attinorum]|uniref:Uncharacterized protein n=1 Tax=Cyphellophora attinorum TaxID=1664694 RepID=A0A0N1GXC7_9EURO|nr:uncharacterized protein AB675_4862 [Phialophora attinorum]KPI34813.1 hypothetical protein AB675_4862 [Phialophora attinorum]
MVIRSDLIDRLSFLFPGTSEIFSLGLGIIIGAALLSAIQRATHTHTRLRQTRSDVESTLKDRPDEHILRNDTKKPLVVESASIPPLPITQEADSTHEPRAIQNVPTPSSQLADLPLPLRSTIHQPHNSAEPWTSSDLIEHSRLARANYRSPWKRHTFPAMHVTDHVHYYSDQRTLDQASNPKILSTEESLPPQRQWRRRRVLTFEPLLSSSAQTPVQSGPSPETEQPIDPSAWQSPKPQVAQTRAGMEAPITALQVEIEQHGVFLPNDAEREMLHRS